MRTSALSCKAPWTRWRISAASPSSGDVSHRRTNSASTARTDRIGRRNMKRLNGIEAMRETFQQRLPLLDPLRYELVEIPWKLHHPMWAEESDVDLDYHLRKARV